MTLEQGQKFFEIANVDRSDLIEVLANGTVGHLGCVNHNEVYVVPVTYAYDHGYIYSHSRPGKKIEMMRASPQVCLQVEDIDNVTNWKSVLAWGKFEEIRGELSAEAKQLLLNKLAESVQEARAHDVPTSRSLTKNFELLLDDSVMYRIKIDKISGCSEADPL